ncbi:hypothetical protein L1999_19910 [Neobacillus drentensis]|uniref:DUF3892 domain-containing protein n=1 Tax=Neobacillus drentensis TaxID=220684 RepID=UPI001F3E27F4|nr:DUF3892 domain-containing protein [Neobacillus drentensis]ULT55352.1 hypothetical protein L1999_19910 [Neobacillus drentensis]
METITAVHRNHSGEVINFVTSEGRVISYRKALMDVEQGLIQGMQTCQDTHGRLFLIPEFEQSFDHFPNLF